MQRLMRYSGLVVMLATLIGCRSEADLAELPTARPIALKADTGVRESLAESVNGDGEASPAKDSGPLETTTTVDVSSPEPNLEATVDAPKEPDDSPPDAEAESGGQESLAENVKGDGGTLPAKDSRPQQAEPEAVALAPLPKPAPSASDEFFAKGTIPNLHIRLSAKEEQQLRADPRRYVDCTLIEDETKTYKKVKVKLKGAAGSFRNLDDRPALTLSMKKKEERFHGLKKFHLNNSVQDESYLNEYMAAKICAEAGYPATRVTHARVWINDRDVGFYVLKEGFDELFLARHFSNPTGNLYDGGFCQDIDANLELDEGEDVPMLGDLKAVIAACREGDQAKRWQQVAEKVDVDAFLTFTALELMMSHWDGYCQNRNNYRVYFDADSKKIHFFLHGMDQMFGDPNFSVFHVPGPIVCQGVLTNPEWQKKYRERVRELLPLFEPEKLHKQIGEVHARIRPAVEKIHPDRAKHLDGRVQEVKNRLNDRQKNIRNQFPPEPIPLNAEGWALLEGWEPKQTGDAKLEKKTIDGKEYLSIETGPSNQCQASYRTKVRLGKGSYRLEAKVKPTNVTAIPGDAGVGAGLRISGGTRTNQAVGTSDWQTVAHTLDVAEELREFDLVAELRSTSGSVLFDPASMRVVKVK